MTASPTTPGARLEAGSFRDPESRVFYTNGEVYRALSGPGLADWEKLKSSGLYDELAKDGRIVATEQVAEADVPASLPGEWAGVLRHETIPTISYPYEWSFSQLKDAALLQLDLLLAALKRDMILKDSTPYNVQFRGAQPTFIDIGSFEALRPGEPWVGYRQFCMLFLYPLMLQAYKGVDFQPWLRGSLDGIEPTDAASLLKGGKGTLTHVRLHARLERKYANTSRKEVKRELQSAGFKPEMVQANLRRMRKLVAGLQWRTDQTAWTGYGEGTRGYEEADVEAKKRFVAATAERVKPRLAWDLGTNDGAFARIVAPHAEHVVASDFDHETVEHLYRALREEGDEKVLPLVVDLTDPSPARGWRGRERRTLEDRGRPELTLSLALIHHLSITRNVPVEEVVNWLASLGGIHVVEFPVREDAMVQRLLNAKLDTSHPDYDLAHFERCLQERFEVRNRLELGSRVLFEAAVREP